MSAFQSVGASGLPSLLPSPRAPPPPPPPPLLSTSDTPSSGLNANISTSTSPAEAGFRGSSPLSSTAQQQTQPPVLHPPPPPPPPASTSSLGRNSNDNFEGNSNLALSQPLSSSLNLLLPPVTLPSVSDSHGGLRPSPLVGLGEGGYAADHDPSQRAEMSRSPDTPHHEDSEANNHLPLREEVVSPPRQQHRASSDFAGETVVTSVFSAPSGRPLPSLSDAGAGSRTGAQMVGADPAHQGGSAVPGPSPRGPSNTYSNLDEHEGAAALRRHEAAAPSEAEDDEVGNSGCCSGCSGSRGQDTAEDKCEECCSCDDCCARDASCCRCCCSNSSSDDDDDDGEGAHAFSPTTRTWCKRVLVPILFSNSFAIPEWFLLLLIGALTAVFFFLPWSENPVHIVFVLMSAVIGVACGWVYWACDKAVDRAQHREQHRQLRLYYQHATGGAGGGAGGGGTYSYSRGHGGQNTHSLLHAGNVVPAEETPVAVAGSAGAGGGLIPPPPPILPPAAAPGSSSAQGLSKHRRSSSNINVMDMNTTAVNVSESKVGTSPAAQTTSRAGGEGPTKPAMQGDGYDSDDDVATPEALRHGCCWNGCIRKEYFREAVPVVELLLLGLLVLVSPQVIGALTEPLEVVQGATESDGLASALRQHGGQGHFSATAVFTPAAAAASSAAFSLPLASSLVASPREGAMDGSDYGRDHPGRTIMRASAVLKLFAEADRAYGQHQQQQQQLFLPPMVTPVRTGLSNGESDGAPLALVLSSQALSTASTGPLARRREGPTVPGVSCNGGDALPLPLLPAADLTTTTLPQPLPSLARSRSGIVDNADGGAKDRYGVVTYPMNIAFKVCVLHAWFLFALDISFFFDFVVGLVHMAAMMAHFANVSPATMLLMVVWLIVPVIFSVTLCFRRGTLGRDPVRAVGSHLLPKSLFKRKKRSGSGGDDDGDSAEGGGRTTPVKRGPAAGYTNLDNDGAGEGLSQPSNIYAGGRGDYSTATPAYSVASSPGAAPRQAQDGVGGHQLPLPSQPTTVAKPHHTPPPPPLHQQQGLYSPASVNTMTMVAGGPAPDAAASLSPSFRFSRQRGTRGSFDAGSGVGTSHSIVPSDVANLLAVGASYSSPSSVVALGNPPGAPYSAAAMRMMLPPVYPNPAPGSLGLVPASYAAAAAAGAGTGGSAAATASTIPYGVGVDGGGVMGNRVGDGGSIAAVSASRSSRAYAGGSSGMGPMGAVAGGGGGGVGPTGPVIFSVSPRRRLLAQRPPLQAAAPEIAPTFGEPRQAPPLEGAEQRMVEQAPRAGLGNPTPEPQGKGKKAKKGSGKKGSDGKKTARASSLPSRSEAGQGGGDGGAGKAASSSSLSRPSSAPAPLTAGAGDRETDTNGGVTAAAAAAAAAAGLGDVCAPFLLLNLDLIILDASPAMAALLGTTPESVRYRRLPDILQWLDVDRVDVVVRTLQEVIMVSGGGGGGAGNAHGPDSGGGTGRKSKKRMSAGSSAAAATAASSPSAVMGSLVRRINLRGHWPVFQEQIRRRSLRNGSLDGRGANSSDKFNPGTVTTTTVEEVTRSARPSFAVSLDAWVEDPLMSALQPRLSERALVVLRRPPLHGACDQLPLPLALLHPRSGCVLYWSRYAEELTGCSAYEALGQPVVSQLLLLPDGAVAPSSSMNALADIFPASSGGEVPGSAPHPASEEEDTAGLRRSRPPHGKNGATGGAGRLSPPLAVRAIIGLPGAPRDVAVTAAGSSQSHQHQQQQQQRGHDHGVAAANLPTGESAQLGASGSSESPVTAHLGASQGGCGCGWQLYQCCLRPLRGVFGVEESDALEGAVNAVDLKKGDGPFPSCGTESPPPPLSSTTAAAADGLTTATGRGANPGEGDTIPDDATYDVGGGEEHSSSEGGEAAAGSREGGKDAASAHGMGLRSLNDPQLYHQRRLRGHYSLAGRSTAEQVRQLLSQASVLFGGSVVDFAAVPPAADHTSAATTASPGQPLTAGLRQLKQDVAPIMLVLEQPIRSSQASSASGSSSGRNSPAFSSPAGCSGFNANGSGVPQVPALWGQGSTAFRYVAAVKDAVQRYKSEVEVNPQGVTELNTLVATATATAPAGSNERSGSPPTNGTLSRGNANGTAAAGHLSCDAAQQLLRLRRFADELLRVTADYERQGRVMAAVGGAGLMTPPQLAGLTASYPSSVEAASRQSNLLLPPASEGEDGDDDVVDRSIGGGGRHGASRAREESGAYSSSTQTSPRGQGLGGTTVGLATDVVENENTAAAAKEPSPQPLPHVKLPAHHKDGAARRGSSGVAADTQIYRDPAHKSMGHPPNDPNATAAAGGDPTQKQKPPSLQSVKADASMSDAGGGHPQVAPTSFSSVEAAPGLAATTGDLGTTSQGPGKRTSKGSRPTNSLPTVRLHHTYSDGSEPVESELVSPMKADGSRRGGGGPTHSANSGDKATTASTRPPPGVNEGEHEEDDGGRLADSPPPREGGGHGSQGRRSMQSTSAGNAAASSAGAAARLLSPSLAGANESEEDAVVVLLKSEDASNQEEGSRGATGGVKNTATSSPSPHPHRPESSVGGGAMPSPLQNSQSLLLTSVPRLPSTSLPPPQQRKIWGMLLSHDEASVETCYLDVPLGSAFSFGRSSKCTKTVSDTFVSSVHFTITRSLAPDQRRRRSSQPATGSEDAEGGKRRKSYVYTLRDCSANGTYVNVKKIGKDKSCLLHDGTLITFRLSSSQFFLGFMFILTDAKGVPLRDSAAVARRGNAGSYGLSSNVSLTTPTDTKTSARGNDGGGGRQLVERQQTPSQSTASLPAGGAKVRGTPRPASLSTPENNSLASAINTPLQPTDGATGQQLQQQQQQALPPPPSSRRGPPSSTGPLTGRGSRTTSGSRRPTQGGSSNNPTPSTRETIEWKIGEEMLGKGGNAEVYLGINLTNGQLIAVKRVRLPPTLQGEATKDDPEAKALVQQYRSLQEEINVLSKAVHPNIVQYYGSSRNKHYFNILLEFVPGGSLRHLLDNFGALSPGVILSYLRQALEGLRYLHHHNIVHSDIKTANILITEKGKVKLTDFGTAKLLNRPAGAATTALTKDSLERAGLTGGAGAGGDSAGGHSRSPSLQQGGVAGGGQTFHLAGTLRWMDPALFRDRDDPITGDPAAAAAAAGTSKNGPTKASDMWSVGCAMIEMMSGEAPWYEFEFESEEQIVNLLRYTTEPPEIPECPECPELVVIAAQCLRMRPSERPTVEELLSTVEGAAERLQQQQTAGDNGSPAGENGSPSLSPSREVSQAAVVGGANPVTTAMTSHATYAGAAPMSGGSAAEASVATPNGAALGYGGGHSHSSAAAAAPLAASSASATAAGGLTGTPIITAVIPAFTNSSVGHGTATGVGGSFAFENKPQPPLLSSPRINVLLGTSSASAAAAAAAAAAAVTVSMGGRTTPTNNLNNNGNHLSSGRGGGGGVSSAAFDPSASGMLGSTPGTPPTAHKSNTPVYQSP